MMLGGDAMRRFSALIGAAAVMAGLVARPAAAQSFRMTFLPKASVETAPPAKHAQQPRPTSMARLQPQRTHQSLPASDDCAMVVPANPDIDQRMTLLHPPPDIKFSMRLSIVPPCKR